MKGPFQTVVIRELFSKEAIKERVAELAKEIAAKYLPLLEQEGSEFRLVLVGILNGCDPLMGDLSRALSQHFPAGYIEKDYVSVSSRGPKNESGPVRLLLDTKRSLESAHVIIVEDIVDTGGTLAYLWPRFLSCRPATLELCVLVDKTPDRQREVQQHYVGFKLAKPLWLVGYGLDSQSKYRELPFIGYIPQ